MKKHFLREAAKVAIGLVIADILCALWLSTSSLLPVTVLGVDWSASAIWPGIIFDAALILLLSHYAWNMQLPIKSPSERGLLKFVGLVFLVIAVLHLLRIALGWNLILGEAAVPVWVSWLGVLIPAYLSYSSFHFAFRK